MGAKERKGKRGERKLHESRSREIDIRNNAVVRGPRSAKRCKQAELLWVLFAAPAVWKAERNRSVIILARAAWPGGKQAIAGDWKAASNVEVVWSDQGREPVANIRARCEEAPRRTTAGSELNTDWSPARFFNACPSLKVCHRARSALHTHKTTIYRSLSVRPRASTREATATLSGAPSRTLSQPLLRTQPAPPNPRKDPDILLPRLEHQHDRDPPIGPRQTRAEPPDLRVERELYTMDEGAGERRLGLGKEEGGEGGEAAKEGCWLACGGTRGVSVGEEGRTGEGGRRTVLGGRNDVLEDWGSLGEVDSHRDGPHLVRGRHAVVGARAGGGSRGARTWALGRGEGDEFRGDGPEFLKVICGLGVRSWRERGRGQKGGVLCTTPSQRASCCSLRRFVTRLTLPNRT